MPRKTTTTRTRKKKPQARTRKKKPQAVRALDSFGAFIDGRNTPVVAGQLYPADHPVAAFALTAPEHFEAAS